MKCAKKFVPPEDILGSQACVFGRRRNLPLTLNFLIYLHSNTRLNPKEFKFDCIYSAISSHKYTRARALIGKKVQTPWAAVYLKCNGSSRITAAASRRWEPLRSRLLNKRATHCVRHGSLVSRWCAPFDTRRERKRSFCWQIKDTRWRHSREGVLDERDGCGEETSIKPRLHGKRTHTHAKSESQARIQRFEFRCLVREQRLPVFVWLKRNIWILSFLQRIAVMRFYWVLSSDYAQVCVFFSSNP